MGKKNKANKNKSLALLTLRAESLGLEPRVWNRNGQRNRPFWWL